MFQGRGRGGGEGGGGKEEMFLQTKHAPLCIFIYSGLCCSLTLTQGFSFCSVLSHDLF